MYNIMRPLQITFFMIAVFLANIANANTVPSGAEGIFKKSPIPRNELSIWIAPVDSKKPLVDWQSDVSRQPASVTKALTTGISLLLLGENYRWRTEFFTDGNIADGALNGNLYIKGYGNPYFVEEELRDMIAQLQALGIYRITGSVVLDNSYFVHHVDRLNDFDGEGSEPYNALPDALAINFRTATVKLNADAKGVHVNIDPQMTYFKVHNRMKVNRKPCRVGKGFSPKYRIDSQAKSLTLTGTMSRKCHPQKETRVLGDAGDLLYAYFKREWTAAGGTLDGSWLYGQAPANAKLIYTAQSKPLYEQIAAMNKHSNNIMTRQLFLTMGAELTQAPATVDKGRAVLMERIEKMGINTQGMYIDNGSGLSRQTRITARQMGQYLLAMQALPIANYFEDSLSVAGVDGTLKYRLKNSPLAGNLIGKTGTLKGVKAQAGYFSAKSGRKFAYTMLIASKKKGQAVKLMDELFKWVYFNY